ncbi:hypothetical protein PybrP1_003785 [[Pythium] brassicae (nom. inval.)]|nr:hypothetical protein PybrP1_003785 [[Pythium] brassicae (nom. inval.)]
MADATTKLGKIFIGGLSYETTDEKLRSYFAAYGSVTDAVVMKDPISRRSRGFGFITYADPACVDRALAQPTHILDSRRVEAKRAVPRAESARDLLSTSNSSNSGMSLRSLGSSAIPSNLGMSNGVGATKKIFVGGLHYETKDVDFKKYFAQFGKVVSAEVMFNRETNKSRGFGFVIFESETSVELVLQEANHVIDGKSVEVKRAVPRTDVPPPRSVSSRAGSFSGTTGPGSVCSLEDLSVSSTATTVRSVPGTPSRSNGLAASSSAATANNQATSGTLVGYAAAVRFGRGIPKSFSSSSGPLTASDLATPYHGANGEIFATDGVTDALSSLALGDSSTTPSVSASSSLDSPSHLLGSSMSGHFSPLGSTLSPLAADPVIEQWNLSPAAPPQASAALDVPFLSQSESSYLSGALGPDVGEDSQLSWQAAPWDQAWPSLQPPPPSQGVHSSRSPSSPSFFPMFSTQSMGSPGTSLDQSAWNPPEYAPSSNGSGMRGNGFGGGMMGMSGSGYRPGARFGRSGLGIRSDDESPYSALGGFLQPTAAEFLPQQEPELPLETSLESLIGGADLGPDDDLEKKQRLDFALPSSPSRFQHQHHYSR